MVVGVAATGGAPVGMLPGIGVPPVVVIMFPDVQTSYPTYTRFFLSPARPDLRTAPETKLRDMSANTQRTDRVLVFMLMSNLFDFI